MNFYPDIMAQNEQRVIGAIKSKLLENGYIIGQTLSIQKIEEAMPVKYELFKMVMNLAKEYQTYVYSLRDEYHFDLFSYPSAFVGKSVIDALTHAVLDGDNEYINFYIHALNFGGNWRAGILIDEEGNDIPLVSIDDLWRILLNNAREVIYKSFEGDN